MSELYNRIIELCEKKGISGYRLCKDIGMRPSILTDLKMERQNGLSAKSASKIADYFGVSVGYLLGTEEPRRISDEDIKFALFGDAPVSDKDLEDVKQFAAFILERKRDE